VPGRWIRSISSGILGDSSVGQPVRNEANPTNGCRVQQTCKVSSRVNRRSREERQGRNESGGWHFRADGSGAPIPALRGAGWLPCCRCVLRDLRDAGHRREWMLDADVVGGAIFGQPQERRSGPDVTCSATFGKHGVERKATNRASRDVSPKERRRSGGPGHWSTRPHGSPNREAPRRSTAPFHTMT